MEERNPKEVAVDIIMQIESFYNVTLTKEGCIKIYRLALNYSDKECMKTLDIALRQYDDPVEVLMKFGGILYNRARIRQKYIENEENDDEVHD